MDKRESSYSVLRKWIRGKELTLSQITLAIVIRIARMMMEVVEFSLQQRQDHQERLQQDHQQGQKQRRGRHPQLLLSPFPKVLKSRLNQKAASGYLKESFKNAAFLWTLDISSEDQLQHEANFHFWPC